jgi:hypothetical protein
MPSSALSTAPLPSLSAIPLDRSPSAWSDSATPFSPSGGILGSFRGPNDASDADTSSSATASHAGGGLLAALSQPVDEPANDPWRRSKGPAWDLPTPSPFPPRTFPSTPTIPPPQPFEFPPSPPVPYLDSAKYWGAAPTPSVPESPAHALYLSSVPQPPRWDQVPTNLTNSAAQIFSTPPGPGAWGVPAPYVQDGAASNSPYSPSAPTGQTDPNRVRLAGMAAPFPGLRPLPPFPLPGTPEWTHHFIRGTQRLIHALRSTGRGRGQRRRGDDDDYCYGRYLAEMGRCNERYDDYAHQDFLRACKERATRRWDLCNRNGGRPHPNELPEWSEKDEEIERNFGR